MSYRDHSLQADFGPEAKIEVYRQMARVRRFEQAALMRYNWGKMGGWLNLSIGQEGVTAGVRSVMKPSDHCIAGSRGIGHAIAAGLPMRSCMAELYGKTGGCSKGKGGAFSLYAPERGFWGCHGVAAAQTPLAAGLAFGLKQRDEAGAVVCFLGDGAVNQGVYHESLNLAGLFDLPVVYLIENNGYALGSSVARSSRFKECLARRAETYGIEWDRLDDDDLYEVRAKVGVALERARQERRPSVVEIATCRYYGHSVADAMHKKYRTKEEIEERKAHHDPLNLWREQLGKEAVITADLASYIDQEAKAEAAEAVEFAENSPAPGIGDLLNDVYWEIDHGSRASETGRYFFGE